MRGEMQAWVLTGYYIPKKKLEIGNLVFRVSGVGGEGFWMSWELGR
jgi:hypothetical protein